MRSFVSSLMSVGINDVSNSVEMSFATFLLSSTDLSMRDSSLIGGSSVTKWRFFSFLPEDDSPVGSFRLKAAAEFLQLESDLSKFIFLSTLSLSINMKVLLSGQFFYNPIIKQSFRLQASIIMYYRKACSQFWFFIFYNLSGMILIRRNHRLHSNREDLKIVTMPKGWAWALTNTVFVQKVKPITHSIA